jgi:hypothetical protein
VDSPSPGPQIIRGSETICLAPSQQVSGTVCGKPVTNRNWRGDPCCDNHRYPAVATPEGPGQFVGVLPDGLTCRVLIDGDDHDLDIDSLRFPWCPRCGVLLEPPQAVRDFAGCARCPGPMGYHGLMFESERIAGRHWQRTEEEG